LGLFLKIVPTIIYGIEPLKISNLAVFSESLDNIYSSSLWYYSNSMVYLTSYFVGVIIAYAIIDTKFNINKTLEVFLWILSICFISGSLLWEKDFVSIDPTILSDPSSFSWLMWFSLGRFGLTLGFAWIIYALYYAKGGLVKKLLWIFIYLLLSL
jgi:hypothetical protein